MIHPKKHLSQNFLIDPNVARKIVRTADVQPSDTVLEIGPGKGALTTPLLATGARVFAIEIDPNLAATLAAPNLTVFNADALTFPLDTLPHPLKVVANLPYHITTPLLEKLFSHSSQISTLTLMVQKELAARLTAKPSTPAFSSLTLFTQFHTLLQTHFPVSASCFYPRPSVSSTVIHLATIPPPLPNPQPFFSLVRRAFQQRRKMIRTSLKTLYPQSLIDAALTSCGLSPQARPEALSLSQWLAFFAKITA